MFGFILLMMYGIIFVTRWLDYWEFLPNEILHHHGPWSDLERFPTMNLKFDKEIPDIFEHFLFGSGRLIFHVQNEAKSIVLDNVHAHQSKGTGAQADHEPHGGADLRRARRTPARPDPRGGTRPPLHRAAMAFIAARPRRRPTAAGSPGS